MKATSPLEGVKVLDFTHYLAGPYCSMVLADMGADVVKVERPEVGEDGRRIGTTFVDGNAALWLALNRNKRSVAANLKDPNDFEFVRQLALRADVIVENYRPGSLERLGLGYDALSPDNPGLVYASLSGYGLGGPMEGQGGFNLVLQAETGLLSITGSEDGPPAAIPLDLLDTGTGMYAALGVLGALTRRGRTGAGARVEASLIDTAIGWTLGHMTVFHLSGQLPERLGTADKNTVPTQAFATKDGHMVISTGSSDELWRSLCQVLAAPELGHDPRFANNAARVENRRKLVTLVEAQLDARTTREWVKALTAVGVPCAPVNTLDAGFAHPQVEFNGMILQQEHPSGVTLPMPALPVKIDQRTWCESPRVAPPVGQDTAAVQAEWLGG